MRLNTDQQAFVRDTVATIVGEPMRIYVFGSRLKDGSRGGDLDLFIEGRVKISMLKRARIKLSLEAQLRMPVDVISAQSESPLTAFQEIARMQGVLL
jgi:predicted nucleotidyltransferase